MASLAFLQRYINLHLSTLNKHRNTSEAAAQHWEKTCSEVEQLKRRFCTLYDVDWLWSGPFPLHWAMSYFEGHLIFGSKKQHYWTRLQSLVYVVNILVYTVVELAVHVPDMCMALLAGLKGGRVVCTERNRNHPLEFEMYSPLQLQSTRSCGHVTFPPLLLRYTFMHTIEATAPPFTNFLSYLCLLCQKLLLFWMFPECTVHYLMCIFPYLCNK